MHCQFSPSWRGRWAKPRGGRLSHPFADEDKHSGRISPDDGEKAKERTNQFPERISQITD